jgi:outer membrane lipoprotein carrier protein
LIRIASGLSLLIAGMIFGTSLVAEEISRSEGEILLDKFLQDVKTMSARFEQSLVDENDAVVEESAGTLQISRPGRFRWANTEPYEQLLVADGVNIWSYDADLMQVTVKAQEDILQSTPALLLGGSSDALQDFDLVGSYSDRGTVWVRLKPKDSDSGFERVELGFTDGDLSRMIFTDNLEQTTLVALFDVVINEAIADEQFEFLVPPGVDLVGVPALSKALD